MTDTMRKSSGLFIATKAIGGDAPDGTFEGLVTAFGNPDSHGDIGLEGMFARTIEEWTTRNRSVPILWDHASYQPAIGAVQPDQLREVKAGELGDHPAGLHARGELFVDASPRALEVYAGMKARTQVEFSYGYVERGTRVVELNGIEYNGLTDVDLYEISPTFLGSNPTTTLLDVKSKDGDDLDDDELEAKSNEDRTRKLIDRLRFI
jgi:HK97 family phage prohead protease